MSLSIVTLFDRPDLGAAADAMETGWPEFMKNDPMSWNLATLVKVFPECQLVALDGDTVIAKGHCAPVPWSGEHDDLPDQGWDLTLGRAVGSAHGLRPATAVSAFEIAVDPRRRGEGLSRHMVAAMVDLTRRLGFSDLVAPVRPNAKHEHPHMSMAEYVAGRRDDGLPLDPWLRVHARLGGVIVKVCPAAMAITGSLRQWREWTGMPFDRSGDLVVPGALAPVHVSVEHDHAAYVEANVWMHHRINRT